MYTEYFKDEDHAHASSLISSESHHSLGVKNLNVSFLLPANHVVELFLIVLSGQWSFNDSRIQWFLDSFNKGLHASCIILLKLLR